jgi:MinD superfamily P-loop ATPase
VKQLVVLSGKGGTGKTSVAAALAHLASQGPLAGLVVLADADVDAANLELLLKPRVESSEEFWGSQVALIEQDDCVGCGECVIACRFDAIDETDGVYRIDPIACEGCAACVYVCPTEAISMHAVAVGESFVSESRYGPLFHAALRPAQENSGQLVALVKESARQAADAQGRELLLIDGPPGTGCAVISATTGADAALIVAEPTVSGVHDMARVMATTDHFGVRAMVCINKADIYPEGAAEIEAFCAERDAEVVGRIPYDLTITEAMMNGEPVTSYRPDAPASRALRSIWRRVTELLLDQHQDQHQHQDRDRDQRQHP